MDVTSWLLDSDPSIRWQVLRDVVGAPADVVAEERSRVANEGWGAQLLDLQWEDGSWDGGAWGPADFSEETWKTEGQAWTSTMWTLALLADLGVVPTDPRVAAAVEKVAANVKWEYAGENYFDGEVEACINGRTVRAGEYFGRDMSALVARLLSEQKPDGGWNCFESEVSSFDSTLGVLEGFVEFVSRRGPDSRVDAAIDRALEYMYARGLFRGLRSGEPVQEYYLCFTYPNRHNYHVLRILDLVRASGRAPDPRAVEAISVIRERRGEDGRWLHEGTMRGRIPFVLEEKGEPGRWTTLIATRVLNWWDAAQPVS
ncbi:hypothetical protein [Demequina sp.]|uniref:hypothetical protein n=1 Tax=Demequina sp. TaxID=2050685 RepID=UPI003D0E269B